jgi:hypothetical protein
MEGSFVRSNKASLDRLVALLKDLDEQFLQRTVNGDWSITATLAHVAFWDQICVARWDAYDAGGTLENLPDATIDLVNAANLPAWHALSGRTAAELAIRAMDELDGRIASLPEEARWAAEAGGFLYMLDRTRHRDEHAAEIAAALVPQRPAATPAAYFPCVCGIVRTAQDRFADVAHSPTFSSSASRRCTEQVEPVVLRFTADDAVALAAD